ncbi:hypothetical protein [Pseudarthrobacter sp. W1I19]|uniref:hypothetical protein n=1 Tax=Pseudarthrobacter sp. W1I19 TaxID=3042288 RepID=UPI0027D8B3B0|nr:hypothetical protein [Pseudarthrobacter sp. W1I19]
MEFKKIAVRAEAAELHKRNEAQAAFIAGLAGLCLLAGIFYWGALWIYNTPTLAYSAPNETGLDPILFLQALGMDPWAIAVPCGGTPLLLAVAGYVASDLRFEKCWKARARRKLRVLRKDTLADAKQLMKERRR